MNSFNFMASLTFLAVTSLFANAYPTSNDNWQPLSTGHGNYVYAVHDPQAYQSYYHDQQPQASSYEEDSGHDFSGYGGGYDDHHSSYPVSEHVEVSKPEIIPVYKHVQIPYHKTVNINVPHPILVPVPQPYPIQVPVNKPVPVPIVREISIPIEKIVPYPVEKKVPYPVEKKVPYTVEKHITVHVDKPYPVKVPVIKTIYHHSKGHH